MASRQASAVLHFLRGIPPPGGPRALPDRELLERFLAQRDEAAFAALVGRHGPLVLGVCRRILRQSEDAEDAFQATFLVLAQKAGAIARRESVGSFLYGVAFRIALKVRTRAARRKALQTGLRDLPAPEPPAECELGPELDEELHRLPDKYRIPLVLCYLEGKTTAEAARQVGCPRGTVLSRLARARERLRLRLAGRGLALAAVLAGAGLVRNPASAASNWAHACVPPVLASGTVKAVLAQAVGASAGGLISVEAADLAKGAMQAMVMTKLQFVAAVLLVVGMLGAGAGWLTHHARAEKPGAAAGPELVPGDPNAVRLPAGAAARLGVCTGEAKPRGAPRPRELRLNGSLALDPTLLARVRCRLTPCEVVALGKIQVGSAVKKDDVLAVVSSKDLADKKSDLVDALVPLALDRDVLDRVEKGFADGTVPEAFVLNARRQVMAGSNAANRAERALLAWSVPEEEIKAVKAYAEGLAKPKAKRDPEKEKRWARLEVRAPLAGVVVEKNVSVGDFLVDGTTNLFTVADLRRLRVLAQVSEDDLPSLLALPAEQRRWTIRVPADPKEGVEGRIDDIGHLIDPSQHTATAMGSIPNPEGRLRPGQFVTATITLPTRVGELIVPAAALVEVGRDTIVFVQPDPAKPVYVQRRVVVVRRGNDTAHVRFPLQPGERVVTAGALDLKATLDDLREK